MQQHGKDDGRRLFASLRGYRLSWLAPDAVAALTLAAIAIPEQLATARLAGMPPTAGLLAFAAGSCAFAALGANRFTSVGADSTIAPIIAGALAVMAASGTAHYAALCAVLALLIGAVLLLAGALRAGWIADLLSIPVTTGFLAGISVHIIVGQMPEILGIAALKGQVLRQFADIVRQLPDANIYTASVGIGVIAVALAAGRLSERIPGPLIAFLASGVAVWEFDLAHRGVAVLGALPIEAPHPILTPPNWRELGQLLPVSIIIGLICMIQTAAVVRSFPDDATDADDISRDFVAVGAGSAAAALLGAFAVNASPPRTAIVQASGGRTQLAGVAAVMVIAVITVIAAGAFAFLPQAALSGILVFIGMRIFRVATMREIWRRGGYEILLVAASGALVVLLPIQTGVTMSILLSLVHSIYIIARPDCAVLSRVPGTTVWWKEPTGESGEREPGVLVFAPGAPVNFTNANYIRGRLMDAIAAMPEQCRLVVIEAHGVIDIDYTGSQMLAQAIAMLRHRDIRLVVARLESQRAQRAAEATGLIAALGAGRVFRTVENAIRAQSPVD